MMTAALLIAAAVSSMSLETAFLSPENAAKPQTWYHMMNGNVTKAGITRDFEELAKAGFGGVQMFDAGCEIPPGGLDFNSPEWFDMFRHAASEAQRLGLEICIPNCSGWSSSGGPWNPPSNGMKRVVFTETRVRGPKRFRGELPRERKDNGFYEDIAVVAFPVPKAEMVRFDGVRSELRREGTPETGEEPGFTISSEKAFTVCGVSFQLEYPHVWGGSAELKLEVSEDGVRFRPLEAVEVPLARSGARNLGMRFQAFSSPVTAKAIRGSFASKVVKVEVVAVRPEAKMSLSNLEAKTFGNRQEVEMDRSVATPEQVVAKAAVRKLKLEGDTLEWEVPEGEWTVLRIGYICNGRRNHPASDHGLGLEVDKLSASAMDHHFESYVARLCRELGTLAGKVPYGFNNILVDSYEVGSQNWTQGFEREFAKRRGYDLTPYLPVFSGHVVGSVEESERFLEDFRRVVADMFAENYAGELTRKCHEYGLMCSIEAYGSCPADNLQYGQYCDIPMGEFWSHVGNPYRGDDGNSKYASYATHVWGRKYCATESFTANPGRNAGRWMTTPFDIKAQGDRAFSDGVNRLIYHRYTHQPWADDRYLPGMTMGRWGMHLDRTQTWWEYARPFFRYQARCQSMLQRGRFVADVLFFAGEQAPNQGGNTDGGVKGAEALPFGYDCDWCSTDAMHALRVEGGDVVVPGGVRYRVLALPEVEAMSTKMLRTVRRLQREGAKVAWKKAPTRAPGLGEGAEGDAEVRRLAAEIFAEGAIRGSAGEALKTLGVEPQIAVVGKLPKNVASLNWIHRCEQGADWYFVAMPNREPAEVELSFRSVAKRPEIWDAENGKMGPAAIWREEAGRTVVRVPFGVCGSKFVVFRDSATMSPSTGLGRPSTGLGKPSTGLGKSSTGLGKPSTGLGHFVSAEVRARAFPAVASGKKGELRFLKATYGADTRQKDLTEKLNRLAEAGYVDDVVGNQLAGGDPASMTVKQLEATYVYRGVTNSITLREHQQLIVPPSHGHELKMLPLEAGEDGRFWAWQPLEAVLKAEDGTQRKLRAEVPAPMVVEGAWQVEFPHGFLPNLLAKGAAEKVEFGELVSWTERKEKDINYFSGTAVYRKQVKLPELAKGTRVVLDLGRVKEVAEVTVNGKKYESLWRPPYSVEITEECQGEGALATGTGRIGGGTGRSGGATLEIEVRVANLWVNRLIGDDREFAPDCEWVERRTSRGAIEYGIKELPAWVKAGKTSPTGRHTFTTWRHWGKEDELMESGLMGPVKIRFAVEAK